ncbi:MULTISPECIES: hypothetical protein [unclassified Rhizobacter]|uniref:hypothetical protein n=1 Tax=unclassified Rhizobacter TaxID=2640088 RepID=UPI000701F5DC|nr:MULTISPECIES: hypothetical protein [unclassified Rhizobacter]KQU67930.1 hypothetical protein ASC88_08200 [Rhizobacter sp. Root29]KQW15183.1 hypothetical protein ASC98_13715 [Rhizobacter sp. Root1238]KRB24347.1 hypothetical protein ASE08_17700 [Rhizobacter sp. Root16D2]
MKDAPPEDPFILRVAGISLVAVAVALFMFVSSRAGMSWLGIVMLVGGIVQTIQRRIAYGLEGRPPSGYITGVPAVIVGVLWCALGVAMLARPDFILEMLELMHK